MSKRGTCDPFRFFLMGESVCLLYVVLLSAFADSSVLAVCFALLSFLFRLSACRFLGVGGEGVIMCLGTRGGGGTRAMNADDAASREASGTVCWDDVDVAYSHYEQDLPLTAARGPQTLFWITVMNVFFWCCHLLLSLEIRLLLRQTKRQQR